MPNFTRYSILVIQCSRLVIIIIIVPISLQGVSIVWEPRLGYALIGLTLCDMECLTLGLTEQE